MKSYKVNLVKRYEVVFIKDHASFKKGDKSEMNMCLASKLYNMGKISIPKKLSEDAAELGCTDLFVEMKKDKETV